MHFSRLALLSFVAAVPANLGAAEVVDRIVAVVDRHVIALSEAEQAMELGLLRGGGKELALPTVVERLIEAHLVEREVRRYPGDPVAIEQVRQAVDAVRESFPNQDVYHRVLSAQGMNEEGLERLLSRQVAITRYLDRRFRSLVYVTEEEIQRYYEEEVLPALGGAGETAPPRPGREVAESIQRVLSEKKFNQRVDEWVEGLKARARIRRYVW